MLTKDLSEAKLIKDGRIRPIWIGANKTHYLEYARDLIAIYRDGVGQRRRELKAEAELVLAREVDCSPKRVGGLIKVLEDAGEWASRKTKPAGRFRAKLFRAAAVHHPLVSGKLELFDIPSSETKANIAKEMGIDLKTMEETLFDDVMENHRLEAFDAFQEPRHLLEAYNVAQAQALLYDATSLTVHLRDGFHNVIRHANLLRLVHAATRLPEGGLSIAFDGPASSLRTTTRYGASLAKLLPALLDCENWSMEAAIHRKGLPAAKFCLDQDCGLSSGRVPPPKFHSKVEELFAADWGQTPREGWTLVRDIEPLFFGQTAVFPDFLLRHQSGREVYLEIAGYWKPQYLEWKRRKMELLHGHPLLIATPHDMNWNLCQVQIVHYHKALPAVSVLACLREAI